MGLWDSSVVGMKIIPDNSFGFGNERFYIMEI
jgi:hypothetical protein